MADVRREGPFFVTLRRIYGEQKPDRKGRTLLYPEGKRLKENEVERLGLSVEDDKPAPKAKKK